MKRTLQIIPIVMGFASAPLYAADYHRHGSFNDKAKVVEVVPIYEIVEVPVERRECWTEEVQGKHSGNLGAGMVVGGIIGGVLGHQIGHGETRKITTMAGSVIGAALGAEAARQGRHNEPNTSSEHRCQVHTEYEQVQRLRAYKVTYRYQGETFVTEMAQHPGKFVPVRVQVSLMD